MNRPNYCFCITLAFLLLLRFNEANGHAINYNISYASTATPGVYKITLKSILNCHGLLECTSCTSICQRTLQVKGAQVGFNGTPLGSVVVTKTNVSDLSGNLCPTVKSVCTANGCNPPGTFSPGFEITTFEGMLNTNGIDPLCCYISVSFSECCFIASEINTITSGQNMYTEAIINRCNTTHGGKNSAPEYTKDPVVLGCSGKPYTYNPVFVDPDGDSVHFAFSPIFVSSGVSATYVSPFAFDRPMPWTGAFNGVHPSGIQCNPITGEIHFTPLGSGTIGGVINIGIEKWRKINGIPVLMGKIYFNFPCVILQCLPNNPPFIYIQGQPPNISMIYRVNAGNTLCFNVNIYDADSAHPISPDSTKLFFAYDTKLHPFTQLSPISNSTIDARRVCITPHDSLARSLPYIFNVSAMDSRCPLPDKSSRTVQIFIDKPLEINTNKTDMGCGRFRLSYQNTNQINLQSAKWLIQKQSLLNDTSGSTVMVVPNPNLTDSVNANFQQAGIYHIYLLVSANGTQKLFHDSVIVGASHFPKVASIPDTLVCAGTPVTYQAFVIGGQSPYRYSWKANGIQLDSSTSFSYQSNSNAWIEVRIEDGNQCETRDTFNHQVTSVKADFTMNDSVQCQRNQLILATNTTHSDKPLGLTQWYINQVFFDTLSRVITLPVLGEGLHQLQLLSISENGCVDSITKTIWVSPHPHASFLINDSVQCMKDNQFIFTNTSTGIGQLEYVWNLPGNLLHQGIDTSLHLLNAGSFQVKLKVKSTDGCEDSITKGIQLHPSPVTQFSFNDTTQCVQNNQFIFRNSSLLTDSVVRKVAQTLIFSDTIVFSTPGKYPFVLYTFNNHGCADSASTNLTLWPQPITTIQLNDSIHCFNNHEVILSAKATITLGGINNYQWIPQNGLVYNDSICTIKYPAPGIYHPELMVRSNSECLNTYSTKVEIKTPLTTPIIVGDTVVKSEALYIYKTDAIANRYNWTCEKCTIESGHGSNRITISTTDEEMQLRLVVVDSFDCTSDTALFRINPILNKDSFTYTLGQYFHIYPNPSQTRVTMKFYSATTQEFDFWVSTSAGKVIYQTKMAAKSGLNEAEVELEPYSDGIFILYLENNYHRYRGKVLKY